MVVTGDELLRGFVQDANTAFIAAQLRDIGIELVDVRIVADDGETIEHVVQAAADEDGIDVCIVTGGLGPTHDDRTSEAVAAATARPLTLQHDALDAVEDRLRAHGRLRAAADAEAFAAGNRKQASFPHGAVWLDPLGTAPGYVLDADGLVIIVLPGPPSELRHAWQSALQVPALRSVLQRVGSRHERLLRLWRVPESIVADALAATGHRDGPAARVTLCARDGEIEIAIRGTDVVRVDALTEALDAAFAEARFAIDDERSIIEIVASCLHERAWRLAVAESCTGGMLGGQLTSLEGASTWFAGGFVVYDDDLKSRLTGVQPATLAEHGAVSEPVALELAHGARRGTGADVGIGITGIAGPGGAMPDKPVGTVHVAVVSPAGVRHRRVQLAGDRATVRRRSCSVALHELRLLVADAPATPA